ncbi:hypothetical protein [Pseudomonas sp. PGPR40]|uniref:hypothetical protein n=1 Tax=Pseudomonas sp. PGPR40 TaxID=2913476 RepID=UPI001EDB7F6A|nr:hypothetical protein [Pseudomonas sp. PGPR40]
MITINTRFPILYFTTPFTSSLTSYYIVTSNYRSGIYPATQDSIAIPLIATIGMLVILPISSLIQLPLYKRLKHEKPAGILSITLALFATTLSSALLIERVHYWLAPSHLTISALYFITLSFYAIHQVKLYKRLISRTKNSNGAMPVS